ncbi:general secretion pathway protein GspK [Pseudolysobacter antarcticus]|uniref:Type II secretion system protein K n=1 Tax=Pseudolysobacter antarcticus TaxID=2511995 RepID=A0A411HMM2_9GAMM|nr:type II secretion system minor pseudopilin GspK [Pseudolysobacter antarcticus]QBB71724.1 general secretion pathway protein GspK [Pseudolysobacter antarcticus]
MKNVSSTAAQRGVALLVALLVVALVTLLVAGLLDRGELSAARTRNSLRAAQATAYAQGLEDYAAHVLRAAQIEQPNFDTNSDIWAIPLPPTPVPGGTISARMRDMNGCFNLNNLGSNNADYPKYFKRLLRALQLDPTLANVIIDWLSISPTASSGGAKDNFYLAQPLPYRSANRVFAHVSELRLLKGVDNNVYQALAPYVCVLPTGSMININTATVPILRMLSDSMTEDQATRIWSNGQAHYLSLEAVGEDLKQKQIALDGDAALIFGVQSTYFQARGDITLDALPFTFFSLIEHRNNGADAGIRVLARYRGSD